MGSWEALVAGAADLGSFCLVLSAFDVISGTCEAKKDKEHLVQENFLAKL